jgi:N6-adenosine-specific RNA methylase IME4
MKFKVIVADPPWFFNDRLKMSKTERGAESKYNVMKDVDIINLNVKDIVDDTAVLALWVPGSKLEEGIECCKAWGFVPTQTWIWVKTKKQPLKVITKEISKILKKEEPKNYRKIIQKLIDDFDMNDVLNFFMGHLFRQTHELVIIGTRGKYTKIRKNRSQRSVYNGPALDEHSEKPEELQNRLDIIFPNVDKLEMFARRERPGWTCVGNDDKLLISEDIKDSIERLKKIP